MTQFIGLDDASHLITAGMRVFLQSGTGEASELLEALASGRNASCMNVDGYEKAVDYVAVPIPGVNRFTPQHFHCGARFHCYFPHAGLTPASAKTIHTYSLHYRDIYRQLASGPPFDAAVIQVAPPDEDGHCSLGVSVDFVPALLERCRCVIAEINAAMPRPPGAPRIPLAAIDYAVAVDHPLPTVTGTTESDTDRAIAHHVANLVEDGSCIQVGIGKLPGSILRALGAHRRLGFHSGLIGSEARGLIAAGVITGEDKTVDRHYHVAGLALGDTDFYHWTGREKQLLFRPVNYTHDLQTLAAIERFVSINSALEVDLLGQANAERVGGRTVSSTGGLVDFARGARASWGGKSILALPATALNGQQSRIVAHLGHPALVTLCRADIDHVVTEFGHAALFGLAAEQRAQALVDIASPGHRDALWNQWEAHLSKASFS